MRTKRRIYLPWFCRCQQKCLEITLVNRCYQSLNRQLSSSELFHATKLILYKTLILPPKAWTVLSTNATAVRVFERKVLLKIFCIQVAVVQQVVCWLIRRKAKIKTPGQTSKRKYYFGNFLSADFSAKTLRVNRKLP